MQPYLKLMLIKLNMPGAINPGALPCFTCQQEGPGSILCGPYRICVGQIGYEYVFSRKPSGSHVNTMPLLLHNHIYSFIMNVV
jgi:hypothetical protein